MGSQVFGLQVPSGKVIAAFTPCVRALQTPSLEGERITLDGLETQLDVRHFHKRWGPLSACCADWGLGRGEKAWVYSSLFSFQKWRETSICERNISWMPLTCPQSGTWPATQAWALTGNRTGNLLIHRLELNPLSHTSHGPLYFL